MVRENIEEVYTPGYVANNTGGNLDFVDTSLAAINAADNFTAGVAKHRGVAPPLTQREHLQLQGVLSVSDKERDRLRAKQQRHYTSDMDYWYGKDTGNPHTVVTKTDIKPFTGKSKPREAPVVREERKQLEQAVSLRGNPRRMILVPEQTPSKTNKHYPKSILKQMPPQKKIGKKVTLATAAVARSIQIPRSSYSYNGKQSLHVTHREFIGDIYSTGTSFNALSFATLMPGDPCSYPWLAKIAGSFARYRWKRARLMYVPVCSTTTPGAVIISFDPNAQRSLPTSKVAMLEYECSARGAPWAENTLNCRGMSEKLYSVYGNNVISNLTGAAMITTTDIKTYSAGEVFVACDAVPTGTVGELHIEYEIEFSDPGLFTQPLVQCHIFGTGFPFSFSGTFSSNISGSVTAADKVVFPDFPAGQYMMLGRGSNTSAQTTAVLTPSGPSVIVGPAGTLTTSTLAWSIIQFFSLVSPASLTITAANFANLVSTQHLIIFPYDTNLTLF